MRWASILFKTNLTKYIIRIAKIEGNCEYQLSSCIRDSRLPTSRTLNDGCESLVKRIPFRFGVLQIHLINAVFKEGIVGSNKVGIPRFCSHCYRRSEHQNNRREEIVTFHYHHISTLATIYRQKQITYDLLHVCFLPAVVPAGCHRMSL
jgi:hypothetical protein